MLKYFSIITIITLTIVTGALTACSSGDWVTGCTRYGELLEPVVQLKEAGKLTPAQLAEARAIDREVQAVCQAPITNDKEATAVLTRATARLIAITKGASQ